MSKKKIIATSVLSLAMCTSVITGATYALFTSESETNVSINAGNVKLVATLNLTKTSSMGVDMPTGTFENGGTVSIDEGTITLERMTPGDKAEFEILLDNQSNVNIQYQTIVKQVSDTGLFDGLEIMIEGEEFTTTKVSDWVSVAANAQPADSVIEVSVALPEGAGNEYQGTSTQLSVAVNAVQGNATTTNPDVNTTYIYTASDLVAFANSVNAGNTYEGKTVVLADSINMAGVAYTPAGNVTSFPSVTFKGTFDGNNKTISNLVVSDNTATYASAGLFGSIIGTVKNVTLDNATVTSTHYAGGIVGFSYGTVENCKVTNSTITSNFEVVDGAFDNGDKAGGIVGYLAKEGTTGTVTGCSVADTTVKGYRDLGGIVGYANISESGEESVVTNNQVLENVKIVVSKLPNYKGYDDNAKHDANSIVGEAATTQVSNNTGDATISYVEEQYIGTANELKAFAAHVNGGNDYAGAIVYLTADIDLENEAWTAISNFAGTFDGQGYAISNLSERLFYTINGTVKNLKVANVNVAYTAGTEGGSGFTRYMSGTVENCEFSNITVSTTARGKRMAGLFSEVSGKITGCTVNGLKVIANGENAKIDSGAGGFAGTVKGGSVITDCTLNDVVVDADYANNAAGVFGKVGLEGQASITLKNITVNGLTMNVGSTDVTTTTIANVGGFIGQCDYRTNDSRLTIDNCHINDLDMTITSNKNGEDPTAGFISSLNGGADITNCSVDGKINGTQEPLGVGGFLGTIGGHNAKNAYVVNIINCVADVEITGNDTNYVGGFVAYSGSRNKTITLTLNFTNCEAKGSFYGVLETGTNETSVFTNCKVDGADFAG